MIIVSACLLGENCKYSGGNNRNNEVIDFLKNKSYRSVCPEVDGGLQCPRPPAEICGDRVIDKEGNDVTNAFLLGAEKVLNLAVSVNAELCILKANSPSCGCGMVYDGSFSGKKVPGNGITADLLIKNNFHVISEKDLKND